MSRLAGAVGILVTLLLVAYFARWNGGTAVTVDLGFRSFYRVPLTYVVFASLFFGMLVMLVAGIHADLRVRRFLRERLEEESREERARIDLAQHDLFNSPVDGEGKDDG